LAIGIDPRPLTEATGNKAIFTMTSDEFFRDCFMAIPEQIDLAFIDGSHLFEDALRDFINIERYCGPNSVVVFDDVLPYNQAIAERIQPAGDWTGDVWKIWSILEDYRPDLGIYAVDTFPTGTLVVLGFKGEQDCSAGLPQSYDKIVSDWSLDNVVPGYVLRRDNVLQPDEVLAQVKSFMEREGD
jgi:hypothetical protein